MVLRKIIRLLSVLLLVLLIVVIITSISHPIFAKWIFGTARYIGKPVAANVYTDGKINDGIKVFHVDRYWSKKGKANNYLLSLSEYDSEGMLKFFNINLNEGWIGRPVGTSNRDYDFIMGHLFQSETGSYFTPFENDMKGFNFDPNLVFTKNQIKFNVPPHTLKFDSVRIVFP